MNNNNNFEKEKINVNEFQQLIPQNAEIEFSEPLTHIKNKNFFEVCTQNCLGNEYDLTRKEIHVFNILKSNVNEKINKEEDFTLKLLKSLFNQTFHKDFTGNY